MEEIFICGKSYKCKVNRQNIKRIYIQYKDDTIIIKSPNGLKDDDILKIIKENEIKINNIINKINNKIRYNFKNGSEIYFYGKKYKIIYSDENFIRSEYIYLDTKNPSESYNILARKYGRDFYRNRINYFIEKYKLPYKVNKIIIREMKTRYGVCNIKDKKITFQLHLAVYPLECIDYIILHELTHFKISNHSKNFYQEIEKIMPDYRQRIKKLKEIY